MRCNDDDVWLTNKLAEQIELLTRHNPPLLEFGDAEIVDERLETLGLRLWDRGLYVGAASATPGPRPAQATSSYQRCIRLHDCIPIGAEGDRAANPRGVETGRVARVNRGRDRTCSLGSRPLPFRLYDIAPSGTFGLFLDFGRLGRLRPGYGYLPIAQRGPACAPDDNGIWRGDLAEGTGELILSLADVAALEPDPTMTGAYHYFNHISINPTGTRFFCLHLWTRDPGAGGDWRGRMLTANCDGTDVRLIASEGRPSHYCWCAADRLIVTVVGEPASAATYRLIADGEGDRGVFWDHLPTVDGHPSLSSDGTRLLTNTYPDRYNEQRLLIVEQSGAIRELGRFRPAFDACGARRCDLHPRWARERTIIFDSTHDRGRAIYLLYDDTGVGEDSG